MEAIVKVGRMPIILLVVTGLLWAPALGFSAQPPTKPAGVIQFQHRVCHLFRRENRLAEPLVTKFSHYLYETDDSAPNLAIAGRVLSKLGRLYTRFAERIEAVPAPPSLRNLWRLYNEQEQRVLIFLRWQTKALAAGDLPSSERAENQNKLGQVRRNSTFSRMHIECQ